MSAHHHHLIRSCAISHTLSSSWEVLFGLEKGVWPYIRNSDHIQSYTVQCRKKTELKTMNQIPKSPLRMSSLGVVHCTKMSKNVDQKLRVFGEAGSSDVGF